MSGERALLNSLFGRAAAVVLAATVALVLAPSATATPESDATDAINTAYDAGGGDTGAHVVRCAINAAGDKLGGSAGPVGVPTEDEVFRGDLVSQKFTGGELTWNRSSKEFTTVPPDLAGQLAGLTIPEDATSAI